jgi:hypothetical protein
MAWIPKFRLYNSAGDTLLYTFPAVNYTNAPQSIEDFVEISNLRAQGSIVIDGGESPWDIEMRFTIMGDDYEDITAEIVDLEDTVEFNTPYLLRIDKTGGSYFEYKVKRLTPFTYEENLRNSYQKVQAIFRVNSW